MLPTYPQPRSQLGQSRLAFFFVGMGSEVIWANEWETAFPARAILAAARQLIKAKTKSQMGMGKREWELGEKI